MSDISHLFSLLGSGKTTLLDVIARRAQGQVVGGVYIDGKLLTSQLFRTDCGYVIQADRLLPNLTVRETLTYTARLKFATATKEVIAQRVRPLYTAPRQAC